MLTVKELVRPINAQAGDLLKVSDFVKHGTVDGSWEVGTAAYEKRGVEAFVPAWKGGTTRLPSVSGRVPGQLYPVFFEIFTLSSLLFERKCLPLHLHSAKSAMTYCSILSQSPPEKRANS